MYFLRFCVYLSIVLYEINSFEELFLNKRESSFIRNQTRPILLWSKIQKLKYKSTARVYEKIKSENLEIRF